MQELTFEQVEEVSGGDMAEAAAAGGLAAGIGIATFGTGWAKMGIAAAFAISPIGVIAVVGLSAAAGWLMMQE
ncbi:hypothetical protein [Rheinheimera sp. 1928-s]|uniref:hypothetical protein n=1 Tax=Rheinheimera sp. 1928-s TaxID=3033803 RepID=UPI0026087EA3|nr:hypothetical protein [Rheinheimera sp. 1928-s]MDF3125276.1 hypothetical protein [Rheinheimera sp. 1928-s]